MKKKKNKKQKKKEYLHDSVGSEYSYELYVH